jgi:glyoxylase-like metal-dependent hydrolase (beta-lactamase superfamily II)
MSPSDPSIVHLPAPRQNQNYVTISALDGGYLTLPEKLFVSDADPDKRTTVPSLSFLIQHPYFSHNSNPQLSERTTLLFDLGLKRDFTGYRDAQLEHIAERLPTTGFPDVAESLIDGRLFPSAIGGVILSHVHWDHVGTPSDFTNARFMVGSGTLHLLAHGDGSLYPSSLFNADELPEDRTQEFPPVRPEDHSNASPRQASYTWHPLACFPNTIDFFRDGSVYVVDAPGHLTGHVNLLARVGPKKWVYLGGDCCHDPRILTGEKEIAEYGDGLGGVRSAHANTEMAENTVKDIAKLMMEGRVREEGTEDEVEVEVVVAHDKEWRERNSERFWPGCL